MSHLLDEALLPAVLTRSERMCKCMKILTKILRILVAQEKVVWLFNQNYSFILHLFSLIFLCFRQAGPLSFLFLCIYYHFPSLLVPLTYFLSLSTRFYSHISLSLTFFFFISLYLVLSPLDIFSVSFLSSPFFCSPFD